MYKPNSEERRKQLIKLIHVARRELGMQDEDYRQFLENIPALEGARSCSKLTVPKLVVVLEQLKSKGFKVVPKASKAAPSPRKTDIKQADDAQSRLIRHLWLRLNTLGAVRDSSELALSRFVANRTKVEALQWLSSQQASQVIEHLKNWLKRVES